MKFSDKIDDERIQIENVRSNIKFWQQPLFRQIFVALGPMALIFSSGMGLGTATVMVPQIKAINSSIQIDGEMESWFYSGNSFAAIITVLTVPYLAQIKGYKFAFIIISIPIIIACVLQYFATSAKLLLAATIIQGLTFGGNTILGVVLVAEITHPKYRGIFLVIKSATYFWGVWVSNVIGTFSKWRNIPLVCIWPAVFTLVSCFAWPESPYWLASKGRVDECKKSFRWLRGQSPNAEKELSLLVTKKHPSIKIKNVLSFIKSTIVLPQFYKPMILNIATFFFYQSCGKYVCQTYILVIIKTITKSDRAAYTGMLIIDGITVFGMYLGSYVAKKVSRRFMFFSTSGSTIFFLFALSLYLYLIQFGVINQNNTLSLILLMLYSFSVSWGPMLLCANIFSEITPMRFKPFISSVSACFMYTMQALFLKLGPWLFKSVGFSGTCAVYGTLSIFPVLVLFKYLPETSNRTLRDIELFFETEKHCDDFLSQQEGEEMLICNGNK
ncbi:facilitated trehalose transporter Tret1-like isoform X1 [Choristoneura fumiferana]|uniref:facilitated trehalose transporter Tret1-like isoform X1 n=1 Tax=Choristoneura fumiferana TaxID=7141 RepID=UPI003D158C74